MDAMQRVMNPDVGDMPRIYRCACAGETWETYSKQLTVEYMQCEGEGLDVEPLKDVFEKVKALEDGPFKALAADRLFGEIGSCAVRPDFGYDEPDELDAIRAARKGNPKKKDGPRGELLRDKLSGAWYGRIAGCLLGKTVEGIRTEELIPFLKESGNYPMHRYIVSSDLPEDYETRYRYGFKHRCYADKIECAPVDDDTNYTCLYQVLIERYGRDFTSDDVCAVWLSRQPKTAYCTAERVAYCNMIKGLRPPMTAKYENPYREWIGAQIRGDYFGYINPGDCGTAAEMAWRDARISHVKNGIYGEMLAAALIAAAAVEQDIPSIIRMGLGEIPKNSRLHESVEALLDKYVSGLSGEEAFEWIHALYDEHTGYGWCHTISNALIVCASLLYGGGDYSKSICMAVQTGFDTDCNGATVGSVLGMRGGLGCIDEKWLRPLNGTLDTTIIGVGKVPVESLIERTLRHVV